MPWVNRVCVVALCGVDIHILPSLHPPPPTGTHLSHIDWHMAAGLVVSLIDSADVIAASHIADAIPVGFPTACAAGQAGVHGGVHRQ